jgi:hypothetical protein
VDQTDISAVQSLGLILEPEEQKQVGAAVFSGRGKILRAVSFLFFFNSFSGGGVQLGPLDTGATDWPIVACPV